MDSWTTFLEQLHAAATDPDQDALTLSPASPQAIHVLEQRLGRKLPPSHKSFLCTTNGFPELGPLYGALLSADSVDWFRNTEGDWIRVWLETSTHEPSLHEHLVYGEKQDSAVFRTTYLQSALQIGEVEDGAVFLLNPDVQTSEGEWEAWIFADWFPGAERYPTFAQLMEGVLESVMSLRRR